MVQTRRSRDPVQLSESGQRRDGAADKQVTRLSVVPLPQIDFQNLSRGPVRLHLRCQEWRGEDPSHSESCHSRSDTQLSLTKEIYFEFLLEIFWLEGDNKREL